MENTTNNNSRAAVGEADVRVWLSRESWSSHNLTGFKCPAGKRVQGQALKRTDLEFYRNFSRAIAGGTPPHPIIHTTHFSLPPSLHCLLCPLNISILIFIYLFFSHTCPPSSPIPVSSSRPPSYRLFSSPLSYLSPFSLCLFSKHCSPKLL